MRQYRTPHLAAFGRACQAKNYRVVPLRLFALYSPNDPDALALCIPRPSGYRVRSKHANFYTQVKKARKAGKLHLLRYDPAGGFKHFDRATEPEYNPRPADDLQPEPEIKEEREGESKSDG